MKQRRTWMLSVGLLLVAGLGGCGEKPESEDRAVNGSDDHGANDGDDRKYDSLDKVITNSIGMKLALIPAGEFLMGSRESAEELAKAFEKEGDEPSDFEDEHPQHRVKITRPFYLGSHEVTVGQFRKFVSDTGYKTDAEKDGIGGTGFDESKGEREWKPEYTWRKAGFRQDDDHPVVNVSWNDATAFCQWLSRKEGKTYRLPTEAEWEYACRAGTTTRYYCGDDPESLVKAGNVADAAARAKVSVITWGISAGDGYALAAPVGKFAPNAFGLHDTHGNVWEWCSDWYDEDYYADSPLEDPKGASSGKDRVARGGSWFNRPSFTRSAIRNGLTPDDRDDLTGFRLARTP